jgi:membrane-associated phospholipid phosphatase
MGNTFYFDWEVDLIKWLQTAMGSFGEAISKVLSIIGGETVSLVVLLAVLFCYGKKAGMRCGFTILAASMWFPMIKNIALRLRPYMVHEGIEPLLLPESDAEAMDVVQQGFSFPSGHSAMAAACYASIGREVKKRWMWFLAVIIPLLIGLSRFAVGVHYPTDVLAGWAVGLLAFGFGVLMEKYVKKEWLRYVILLAITLPGIFWCTSRDYFSALGLLIGMTVAVPFEKKYVDFKDTRNAWAMILRVVGAFAIYYLLNTVLKMPFKKEWLDSGTLVPNLVRSARYAIILFIIIGIYPKVFPAFEKIGKKKNS